MSQHSCRLVTMNPMRCLICPVPRQSEAHIRSLLVLCGYSEDAAERILSKIPLHRSEDSTPRTASAQPSPATSGSRALVARPPHGSDSRPADVRAAKTLDNDASASGRIATRQRAEQQPNRERRVSLSEPEARPPQRGDSVPKPAPKAPPRTDPRQQAAPKTEDELVRNCGRCLGAEGCDGGKAFCLCLQPAQM